MLLFGGRWVLGGILRLIVVFALPEAVRPGLLITAFLSPMIVLLGVAALSGEREMAVGSVIGLQMLLVLFGLAVCGAREPVMSGSGGSGDSLALCGATALFILSAIDGSLARSEGVILLLATVAYLAALGFLRTKTARARASPGVRFGILLAAVTRPLVGVGTLIIGSILMVDGAVTLGRALGLPSVTVGATLLAGSAGLAAMRPLLLVNPVRESVQATGMLQYLAAALLANAGIVALLTSKPEPPLRIAFDLWVLVAATVAVLLVLLGSKPLSRIEASGLTLVYVAYVATLFEPLYSSIR